MNKTQITILVHCPKCGEHLVLPGTPHCEQCHPLLQEMRIAIANATLGHQEFGTGKSDNYPINSGKYRREVR